MSALNMSELNKATIKKLDVAIKGNDLETFLSFFTDDVRWTKVGDRAAKGKEDLGQLIKSLGDAEPPSAIMFDAMIAEDDYVAAYGRVTVKGEDGKAVSQPFCDVYRFRNEKIAELTSFVIKPGSETGPGV